MLQDGGRRPRHSSVGKVEATEGRGCRRQRCEESRGREVEGLATRGGCGATGRRRDWVAVGAARQWRCETTCCHARGGKGQGGGQAKRQTVGCEDGADSIKSTSEEF